MDDNDDDEWGTFEETAVSNGDAWAEFNKDETSTGASGTGTGTTVSSASISATTAALTISERATSLFLDRASMMVTPISSHTLGSFDAADIKLSDVELGDDALARATILKYFEQFKQPPEVSR